MARDRAPRAPLQELWDGIRSQGVGGAGRAFNASPVAEQQSAVSRALASIGSIGALAFQYDHWTLAADGAQTKTLTFLPADMSEHVYLNGIEQLEGTDWSRSGQTLSLLSPMAALTGDHLDVRYAYQTGVPAEPVDWTPLNVPFSSTGWKYTHDDPGAGWEQPSFDDSGWASGQMPIGNSGYATFADDDPNTVVPGTSSPTPNQIWVRRRLGPGTNITFSYRMAKYLEVWVDGTSYTSQTFGGYHTASNLFPPIADQADSWLLAATVYDFSWVGGGPTFDIGINLEITGDEA